MTAIYYTPDEAASILRVHPETIKRWLRTKMLAGRKIGKVWRIPVNEVVKKDEKR